MQARTVVIASGARYRRPAVENLGDFEGYGVWYWASPIEGRVCRGQDVIVVGGGNSAGQGAVFLSGHAARVRMMVRGDGLAESMSRYLVERISASSNIEVVTRSELLSLSGTPGVELAQVRWRNGKTGVETSEDISNVFLFAGADPATHWLDGCGVSLDKAGFVMTGLRCGAPGTPALQTSVPGVFAVGDVRAGSVKRCGAAIGEGAQVVPLLHAFLSDPAASPALTAVGA